MLLWSKFNLSVELITILLLNHCVQYVCVYSLLCLREGEADGEGTEVRGAGMGHLRTGSSMILLLSISSIMYSTLRQQEKRRKMTDG